jgi:hypothetical protein
VAPAGVDQTAVTSTVTLTGHEVLLPALESDRPVRREATVPATRLGELAAPLLDRVAALATGIARSGAGGDPADRGIDVVVLSGGSLLAGHLRAQLEERLRMQFDAEGLGTAFDIAFDADHARTGAALGALFLHRHERGHDPAVDLSGLRARLAAGFETEIGGLPVEVFRRGQRLADHDGPVRRARSSFFPVEPHVVVHRVHYSRDGRRVGTEWGRHDIDPAVLADPEGVATLRMAFEIDELERVTLILRRASATDLRIGLRSSPAPADDAP